MAREAPISAVFIADVLPVTVPMLAGWVDQGHSIAAIVVPGPRTGKHSSFSTWRRRLRRRLASRRLGRPPLIEFSRPYDWHALRQELAVLGADVLICFGFNTLIPQSVLALFPKGGLNLHPALLPHYRGPHPVHRLLIDRKHETHGGVTLHKMTSGFDEGDILAQIAFAGEDWHSAATVTQALADAMAVLVTQAGCEYCRGELRGTPQPDGAFTWARLGREPLVIAGDWPGDHVARLCRVIGPSVPVNVALDGQLVRLAQPVRRLGPATGAPPVRRWGMVAFDCADGRVVHLAYNGLSRRLMRWQRRLSGFGRGKRSFEIRRFRPNI